MRRSAWIPVLCVLGCSDPKDMTSSAPTTEAPATDGAEETGGTPLTETGGTPSPTTGIDEPGSSGGSSGEGEGGTTCSFLHCGGDVPKGGECDQWAQDCDDGEKCSAYADDGSNAWNNTKCVAVMDDPGVPGDVCTVEGSGVSGVDSCEKGAMCWDVDVDTGLGHCIALCTGTPEAPVCDAGFECAIANDVLNLCLPVCDPLAQDCVGDDVCIPNVDKFVCVLDASGDEGQTFDPCEYGNACDPGLLCLDPSAASECDAAAGGCCLPFCDLTAPDCPGVGQDCEAFYTQGTAPPGYEAIGFCALPS